MIRKISLLCLLAVTLTGHSQVPILGSTARITTSINGTFFAGEAAYGTIQAAVNAAGTTGSVTILPGYGGTDQWTNPNNVIITDLRPLSTNNRGLRDVYASDFGVKCNGTVDDTVAAQFAISTTNAFNTLVNAKTQYQIHMPSGSCLITAPLVFGVFGSIVGEEGGTYLIGRYDAWTGGSDHNLIEITANGPLVGGDAEAIRTFGHMTLVGIGSNAIPDAEGVKVYNSANVYDPSTYAFGQLSFEHMSVTQFDTAFDIQDMVNSEFNFVWANFNRVAFNLNGDAVQIFFSHVYAQHASWIGTSNHATSTGLFIQPNNKYSANCATHTQYCAPQGIFFHDSSVLAWDNDIDDEQCTECDIHDNTIDIGAGGTIGAGTAITVGPFALGGGLWIMNNYIGTTIANTNLIYITASGSGLGIDGLWIENNHLKDYVTPGSTLGIVFAGGAPLYQVHVNGNAFYNLNEGIVVQQDILDSEFVGNGGTQISTYVLNLDGSGTGNDGSGTVVQNNTAANAVPAIHLGSSTGYTVGFNFSPAQVTGTQVATGTGCTYGAGAGIGNSCSVTMTIPHAYSDAGYTIQGCVATGGTGINGLVPATPTVGMTFTANEVGMNSAATGGGTLACTVTHGAN